VSVAASQPSVIAFCWAAVTLRTPTAGGVVSGRRGMVISIVFVAETS